MKKLIQKGKPSTQSTVVECIGEWDLSELEVIDDNNNANNANNANNDNNVDVFEQCLENSSSEDTDERI